MPTLVVWEISLLIHERTGCRRLLGAMKWDCCLLLIIFLEVIWETSLPSTPAEGGLRHTKYI